MARILVLALLLTLTAADALAATPAAIGLDYEDVSLDAGDGASVHGWFLPVAEKARTVLFLHGNAGNITAVMNGFIKGMLPKTIVRKLTPEEMAVYAAPFPSIGSRKPLLQWPREVPIDGQPAEQVKSPLVDAASTGGAAGNPAAPRGFCA